MMEELNKTTPQQREEMRNSIIELISQLMYGPGNAEPDLEDAVDRILHVMKNRSMRARTASPVEEHPVSVFEETAAGVL